MVICIDTIEKFQFDDMQTSLFLFERLCNLIYPEETIQENKEFFILVEKRPNQEDLLYINKIINLGLPVRDIYKKVWLRYIKSHQATLPTGDLVTGGRPVVNPPQNEHEPMHIIYQFDRLDLEQTSSSLTSSDNDSQFCDLVNDSNGIIDQCIDYIEINSPPVKTYLGMEDPDSWHEFKNKPCLSYILR
ncbi:unnamed protein product [Rotaria sp. Silwood1]|nr:unnamed protein product [Rotaria sp. Silwood1]